MLIDPHGAVIASAASFHVDVPQGCSKREIQEILARRDLAIDAVSRLSSKTLSAHLSINTTAQIMREMCSAGGCKVLIVSIGYSD
ncbi:hypothetical protein GCM10028811_12340 [Uliginosibacterium sediminicola]